LDSGVIELADFLKYKKSQTVIVWESGSATVFGIRRSMRRDCHAPHPVTTRLPTKPTPFDLHASTSITHTHTLPITNRKPERPKPHGLETPTLQSRILPTLPQPQGQAGKGESSNIPWSGLGLHLRRPPRSKRPLCPPQGSLTSCPLFFPSSLPSSALVSYLGGSRWGRNGEREGGDRCGTLMLRFTLEHFLPFVHVPSVGVLD
jgi:hypothetical protein